MSTINDPQTGNGASVGTDFRLKTYSINESEAAASNDEGDGFNINTGEVAITSDTGILYLKNNEDRDLIIEGIAVGFGTGTYTAENCIKVIKNPTTGTLISTATECSIKENRNFGSAATLTADIYEGADGATVTDGTETIVLYQNGAGRLFAEIDLLLPKGTSLAVKIEPGTAAANVYAAIICHLHIAN